MIKFIENFIQPGLIQGLCYGIAAIGISLPLRFLRTADFTAVGAIMVGGVVTIFVTNASGFPVVGLFCGSIAAGSLGLITAFLSLNIWFNIPLMLAGIICFTASQSIGLAITGGESIVLDSTIGFLSMIFSWHDVLVLSGLAVAIIIIGAVIAMSKWGSLAFAMCASSNFVKFRHRSSQSITYYLLFVSNLLVGLSGGLISLKILSAYSSIHMEFLSFTLGSIYAGGAAVQLLTNALKRKLLTGTGAESQKPSINYIVAPWEHIKLSLSEQRDDSGRLWFIFLTYIIAAILLNNLAVAVRTQKFFDTPPALEHAIVAVIIALGFFLSNITRKSK